MRADGGHCCGQVHRPRGRGPGGGEVAGGRAAGGGHHRGAGQHRLHGAQHGAGRVPRLQAGTLSALRPGPGGRGRGGHREEAGRSAPVPPSSHLHPPAPRPLLPGALIIIIALVYPACLSPCRWLQKKA